MNNPWIAHVKYVRQCNPGMSYKEALKKAKKSYVKCGAKSKASPKRGKRAKKSSGRGKRGKKSSGRGRGKRNMKGGDEDMAYLTGYLNFMIPHGVDEDVVLMEIKSRLNWIMDKLKYHSDDFGNIVSMELLPDKTNKFYAGRFRNCFSIEILLSLPREVYDDQVAAVVDDLSLTDVTLSPEKLKYLVAVYQLPNLVDVQNDFSFSIDHQGYINAFTESYDDIFKHFTGVLPGTPIRSTYPAPQASAGQGDALGPMSDDLSMPPLVHSAQGPDVDELPSSSPLLTRSNAVLDGVRRRLNF